MIDVKQLSPYNYVDDAMYGISQIGYVDTRSNSIGLINPDGGSHNGTSLAFIKPIILTPEILIKVGFTEKRNSHGTYYHINHEEFGGYAYDLEKKCITTDYPAGCNGFCSLDIEYLHQLQNVLFFNAGIELIYTP